MSILWCGGEDVDFPGAAVSPTLSYCREGYARCSLCANSISLSRNIGSNPLTSLWLAFRVVTPASNTSTRYCGIAKDSASSSGIYVGSSTSNAAKLALYTWDGASYTQIAIESAGSLTASTTVHKIDAQVINYGASATINLYYDGNLALTFSGDCRITGVAGFNAVGLRGASTAAYISEVIVANEDTRLFSLVTSYPSAAGDANAWTGAYTDIDETTLSDADVVYTTTADQDAQFALSDLPAGTFTVKAVKIAARSAKGATGIGSVSLGVKTGGTVDVDAAHTLTTAWTTEERLMAENPVTNNAWQPSEINALQLNLRSAA